MLAGRWSSVCHRDRLCFVPSQGLQPSEKAKLHLNLKRNGRVRHYVQTGASGRTTVLRSSSTFKIQLIKPTGATSEESYGKLLVYLPGTDGTGQAILPQIPALHGLGYDVWCLYMPPDDRSDWEQLTTQLTLLLRQLLTHWQAAATAARQVATPRITIVAESFGCCLALRLVASGAGPELLDRLVLVNPATSFNDSLSGLSSLIAATNLLSLFPRDWYAVAQNTLLPLLVDGERVDEANQRLLQSMILMEPPPSNQSFGFGAARPPYPAKGPLASAAQTALNGGAATAASAASDGSGALYYAPAAAANFRANLLRSGDPGEEVLRKVEMPVLLITSARDRLLPSIVEGARLERVLPNARRCILPDSGHAALLERGINLAATMQAAGFADDVVLAPVQPTSGAGATVGTSAVAAGPRRSKLRAEAPVAGAAPEPKAASAAPPVATSINASSARESLSIASDTSHPSEAALAAAVPSGALVSASGSVSSELPMRTGQERTAAASNDTAPDGDQKGSSGRRGGSRRSTIAEGGGSKVAANEEHPAAADVDSAFDEWCQKLAPWRDVVSPVVLGFEHLPPPGSPAFSRPMLFVGNHQKMGFYDTPLLVYELYVRGYRVRGLAHPGHWAGPFGRWFESFGSVKASPMAAFRLLRASEKVLLFPGGAKEVVKKRGQEYKLLWKESPDFVRLAARCNALIVPFAAVGADDAYDVIMDTDEVIAHPVLGPLTTGLLSRVSNALDPVESIFPITRMPVVGLPTPIPIPNLQRLYFQFAPPVDPRALGTNINDPQQVQELYDNVKGTVTQCMAELLAFRDADEESQVGARLAKSLQRIVPVLG